MGYPTDKSIEKVEYWEKYFISYERISQFEKLDLNGIIENSQHLPRNGISGF